MCQSWVFGLIWRLIRLPDLKLPSQKGNQWAQIAKKETPNMHVEFERFQGCPRRPRGAYISSGEVSPHLVQLNHRKIKRKSWGNHTKNHTKIIGKITIIIVAVFGNCMVTFYLNNKLNGSIVFSASDWYNKIPISLF